MRTVGDGSRFLQRGHGIQGNVYNDLGQNMNMPSGYPDT